MKTSNILYALLAGVFLLAFTACKKGGDNFLYKGDMLPVTVKGYNGSDEQLEVKLDTFKFKYEVPGGAFNMNEAYIFPDGQQRVKLTITEKTTGKMVLTKELKKEEGPATINFFYYNGQTSEMPEVSAATEGKIKIIYMFMPTLSGYTEPVDIVLGKYYFTPKVFEEITRIKNVKPYQFTEPVTIGTFSTTGQQYNGQPTPVSFVVYLYKAGTNEYYMEGSGYSWHPTASTVPKPAASIASSRLYIFSEESLENSISFYKNLELQK